MAQSAGKGGRQAAPAAANRLGLVLSELTPEQRRDLKLNHGLVGEDLKNGASQTDLRPGDVILALISKGAQTEVKSVDQFNMLLAQSDKAAAMTLLVRRGENQMFITIKGK